MMLGKPGKPRVRTCDQGTIRRMGMHKCVKAFSGLYSLCTYTRVRTQTHQLFLWSPHRESRFGIRISFDSCVAVGSQRRV